jgi:uncharacterized protein
MPVIYTNSLRSPYWLPNGHLQSIYPSLFRKVRISTTPERIWTDDGDFLDLDWSYDQNYTSKSKKLVILSHGLEGNSSRQYITGMVRLLIKNKYDCLAWNYRSCSAEMNLQPRFYHSGETTDLGRIIAHALTKGYTNLYLIGFSLGGNVTLKYLGEQGANIHTAIKKSVVFSVPMDLLACSLNIQKSENSIYAWRFLRTLKPKIKAKSAQFPDKITFEEWESKVKTIYDFDDIYTGPFHGFDNAADYYERSSSKGFIQNITIPTLIVNAKNDIMVPYESLPIDTIKNLDNVTLELTNQGGHCGFRPNILPKNKAYWSETRALDFLKL